ncbi:MAG: hypothetical protein ABSE97_05105 [Verrucomicrobiota bacterium]|jgi:hypothetical protein
MVNQIPQRLRERGMLMAELAVAMAIILVAVLPLAFSIGREQKLLRAYYNKAVAMEIVDGEMEVLVAGEWRAFQEGTQLYSVSAEAAKNLPPGAFKLTITGKHLRLEWLPQKKYQGGKIVREVTVK